MKRMEQLTFMVELNWAIRFKRFDDIFAPAVFITEFNRFLATETGKKWLTSEEGLKFIKWQEE